MPFFRDILGQHRPMALLQGMLKRRNIPNALLFSGEEGIGKQSMAMIFAQTLLCAHPETGEETEPCNRCLSCQKIESGNHPELMIVQPQGGETVKSEIIKIDQIRDLQSRLIFPPMEAAWKVVLIVPAEKMNLQAQNSLLKTLEEPPPYAVLILIANPSLLLPTILSRCQKIAFAPLSFSQVEAIVMARKGWTPQEARLAAALTGGRLGEALSLSIEQANDMEKDYHRLVTAETLLRYDTLFQAATAFSKDAAMFEKALYYLSAFFRDILVLLASANRTQMDSALLVLSWRQEELLEWSNRVDAWQAAKFLADIAAMSGALARNINRQLALETLLMQMRERQQ